MDRTSMRHELVSTGVIVLAAGSLAGSTYAYSQRVPEPPPSADWVRQELDVHDAPGGWGRLQEAVFLDDGTRFLPGGGNATVVSEPGQGDRLIRLGGVSLAFSADGVGIIIVPNGARRSTDRFETSQSVLTETDPSLTRVMFTGRPGVAVITTSDGILRSQDDGETWSAAAAPPGSYTGMTWRTPDIGIAVGGDGLVARTTDAGLSWEEEPTGSDALLRSVAHVDGVTWIAVGSYGTILRSTDDGRTWSGVASPTKRHLRQVAFANERDGLAVGYYGTVLRTRDGGLSWQAENSGTRDHILSVTIARDGTPVLVGWWGMVLTGPRLTTRGDHEEVAA